MGDGGHAALLALLGATLAIAAAAYIVWPLITRRVERPGRAAHEVALLKAQFEEIDRDLARQTISEAEAEGARRELGRRLLAADAALAEESAFKPAPIAVSKRAAVATALTATIGAIGVYALVGAPELPDQPLAERQEFIAFLQDEAERRFGQRLAEPGGEAGGADVSDAAAAQEPAGAAGGEGASAPADDPRFEDLVAATRAALAERPDDHQGRMILASALSARGRYAEAWPLIGQAIDILGDEVSPEFFAALGETMTLAAGGYVSQEAEDAFRQAPRAPVSRYYMAAAALQRGDPEEALAIWMWLLEDVRRGLYGRTLLDEQLEPQIRQLAQEMNLDPDAVIAAVEERVLSGGGGATATERPLAPAAPPAAPPGPSAADIEAAEEMTAEDRQAMIEGMVEGLAARLAEAPEDLPGWLRLIRAYRVMGRDDDAQTALGAARAAFEGDAEALGALSRAAEEPLPTPPVGAAPRSGP